MNSGYVLTDAAEADLRDIIRYTHEHWGAAQVRRYTAQLHSCIERVALGKRPFKDMSRLYPGLRMVHCERHYVFCLPRDAAPALIVAIFHEAMDLMTRLESRLK